MTCKRCEDIHTAQKDGKTQSECKCNCHNITTTSTTGWFDISGATTTDGTINLNFSDNTGTWGLAGDNTLKCEDVHFPPRCNTNHYTTCTGINCHCEDHK